MQTLRSLRRSRDLTILDLAHLTGIPVRLLAEAEYGLRVLSGYERSQLAFVYGMSETALVGPIAPVREASDPLARSFKQGLVAALLVTTLATSALRARETLGNFSMLSAAPHVRITLALPSSTATPSPTASASVTPSPSATPSPSPSATPTASATATPSPSATPMPTATPAFVFTDAGPVGCPIETGGRQVVVTQGYGVGTHAPAETMGGIDLTLDANPGVTLNAVVLATHSGVVRLDAHTWPAGNHIWVTDQASGWRSGYAHLGEFLVTDGQNVTAGTPIGRVGMTGQTTGPHLHYHVWNGGTNVDPTDLVMRCFGR